MHFTERERQILLDVAEAAIRCGLERGGSPDVELCDFPETLRTSHASFVTLHAGGSLRGCIGNLDPDEPLVVGVSQHAFSAAFEDPRFPPLTRDELGGLVVEISVLSQPEALAVTSETELGRILRPGIDGVILAEGMRRATFLPSVWQELSDPSEFIRHLKMKAGLVSDYWSPRIRLSRYGTVSFGRAIPG